MQSELTNKIDRVIEYFNKRQLDLPDGLFDRKSQFIINGRPFEALLSDAPNDPLVLMLARGPAGYRFTIKALQHAIPDAKVERGEIAASPETAGLELWLSGRLRDSGDPINALVVVTLRMTPSGSIEAADATIGGR